jgi:Putative motility protein
MKLANNLEVIIMNAISLSSVMSNSVSDGGGILVMKKALDTFRQEGQMLEKLLSSVPQIADPNLGKNVDIRI